MRSETSQSRLPPKLLDRVRIEHPLVALRPLIQWTLHTNPRLIQHMRVNHRRAHILVAQQLLHCANVIAILEQMSRKAMPQRVTAGMLAQL